MSVHNSLGLFFLVIFIFGFLTSCSGRPHNSVLLNIHKLAALAAFIMLFITARRAHLNSPFSPLELSVVILAVLLFILTGISGGLISALETPPLIISLLHKTTPYLSLISSAACLFMLQNR